MEKLDFSEYFGFRTSFTITNINFFIRDVNKKEQLLSNVIQVKKNDIFSLGIKTDILGSEFINLNEPWESRWINFMIYETNRTGKGFKIIKSFDYSFDLDNILDFGEKISIDSIIIENIAKLKPVQGSFEGVKFAERYNFVDTYLSLRIFSSKIKISNIENMELIFNYGNSILFDSKIPFIQVGD